MEQEYVLRLYDTDLLTFSLFEHGIEGLSTPMRFCSFSPKGECQKTPGKGVQPLDKYTCRFRPSSLKCTDKSGHNGIQASKQAVTKAVYTCMLPTEKNFFGVFLQFWDGVDTKRAYEKESSPDEQFRRGPARYFADISVPSCQLVFSEMKRVYLL